jgi:hypothetical protein
MAIALTQPTLCALEKTVESLRRLEIDPQEFSL